MRVELKRAGVPASDGEPAREPDRSAGLGKALRQMRSMQGMTQQKVADRAKMDRATVSQIENGHSSLMISTVVALAHALDLKVEIRLLPRKRGGA